MRPLMIAFAALSLCAAAAAPAVAQSQAERSPPAESPSGAAREGIEKLLKALELAVKAFPQYEMPRVTERGDIIIRRVNPPAAPAPRSPPPVEDETRT